MRRRIRITLLLLSVSAMVATPAFVLRGREAGGGSEACRFLRQSATTQVGDLRTGRGPFDFASITPGSIIPVPPGAWYKFGESTYTITAGPTAGGAAAWGSSRRPAAIGLPMRGDGLIFYTVADGRIMGLDELSREVTVTITPPTPAKDLSWCDEFLFSSDGVRTLSAFTPDGKLLWTADAGGKILTPLRTGGGLACLAVGGAPAAEGTTATLIALDLRTGQSRWRTPLPAIPSTPPAYDGRAFYSVAATNGISLAAFDAKTGAMKWQANEPARLSWELSVRPRSPAAGDGVVCVAIAHTVRAFDAGTGAPRWDWAPSGLVPDPAARKTILGQLLIRDGVVFTNATDVSARALDCVTGRELWCGTLPPAYSSFGRDDFDGPMPPQLAGDYLFLAQPSSQARVVRLPLPVRPPDPPPVAKPIPGFWIVGLPAGLFAAVVAAFFLRRVWACVALLSLISCGLTTWAWSASYGARHYVGAKGFQSVGKHLSESTTGVTSADGGLTFGRKQVVWETTLRRAVLGDATSPAWYTRAPSRELLRGGGYMEDPPADLGLTRFAWTRRARPSGTPLGDQAETSLTIPHWAAAAVFAVLPLAWLSGIWRDRRRYPKGHCRGCGYDLRASPDHCPECGLNSGTQI